MATTNSDGGDGSVRWCAREGSKGGVGVQGGERRGAGGEGECVALGAGSRSGGSRRWHGVWPACGEHALVLLSREEDDREAVVVGWAGHLGRQVSPGEIPSLSLLSVLYFCFLFCSVLF